MEVDVEGRKLIKKENMLTAKHAFSLCKHYTDIYSIGGNDLVRDLDDCEKYNIKQNRWYKLPRNLN